MKVRYGTTTLNETRYLSEAEPQLSFDYDCRFEPGRSGLHGKLYATQDPNASRKVSQEAPRIVKKESMTNERRRF